MKQDELRLLVRESDTKPFRLCMDDGRTNTVNHPDFAMVAEGTVVIGSGPATNCAGRASLSATWSTSPAWNY